MKKSGEGVPGANQVDETVVAEQADKAPDAGEAVTWSDLTEMSGDLLNVDEAREVIAETPEEKQERLVELAEKARAIAAVPEDEASVLEAESQSTASETSQSFVAPKIPETPKKNPSFLQKMLADRQAKKIDKMAYGKRATFKSKQKVLALVESGKVDLDDEHVLDTYIDLKLSLPDRRLDWSDHPHGKTTLDKIEEMEKLGISPEKTAGKIADKVIERMNEPLTNSDGYTNEFVIHDYGISVDGTSTSLSEMSKILQKYELPGIERRFVEEVNVQAFGDLAVDSTLRLSSLHSPNGEYSESVKRQFAQVREGIAFLEDLGYVPFQNGMTELLDKYRGVERQKMANELGLIDEHVVDEMYHYKFRALDEAFSHKGSLPDMEIWDELKCSGDDKMALFWQRLSEETGEDVMQKTAEKAWQVWPHMSMVVGMMKNYIDAENKEADPMNFFLESPEMLEGADRGFVLALNERVRGVKEYAESYYSTREYTTEHFFDPAPEDPEKAMDMAVQSLLAFGDRYGVNHRLLFDENGISQNAREMAIFNSEARQTLGHFDPNWAKQLPDELAEVAESYRSYRAFEERPELLGQLSPRRRAQVELVLKYPGSPLSDFEASDLTRYFDEQGNAKPELADALFAGQAGRKFLCGTPEFSSFLDSTRQKYLETLEKINLPEAVCKFSDEEIARFFNDDGANAEFWQYEFKTGDFQGIASFAEKSAVPDDAGELQFDFNSLGLSPAQTSVIRVYDQIPDTGLSVTLKEFIKDGELEKYFDESGPTAEFWQYEFRTGKFDCLLGQKVAELDKLGLSDEQLEALKIYDEIDPSLRGDFGTFIAAHSEDIPLSRIRLAPQVLARINSSNSSEMAAHRSAFAKQLLETDLGDDEKMFENLSRIEDVFIHNNLPFVGKVFLSFQILHPPETLDKDFDFSPDSRMSPVLKELPNDAAEATTVAGRVRNRETVIFTDLLKASFGSNNRSIRSYLENLKEGQDLADKLMAGEMDWNDFDAASDSSVSTGQKETLDIFLRHLSTMYNNTESGRAAPYKLTGDLRQDAIELFNAFSPTERHSLSDRVVRSFAYLAGANSFAEAEDLLQTKVEGATLRNREAVKNGLKLERGDFIKGIGGLQYLPNILQNGSVSKEYLGDAANSDATPLDTDLSLILSDADSLSDALGGAAADSYGPIWLVLKGDGNRPGESRFAITRRSPAEEDQQVEASTVGGKMEAFYTGVLGDGHYGIRTGFGSSEIDYFVANASESLLAKAIGLEVALNGFYVPVVDRSSEKVVFSPEDYDALRGKMSGLKYYGTGEYRFAGEDELRFGETVLDGVRVNGIDEIVAELADNEADVRRKHSAIDGVIDLALSDVGGLTRKNRIDGDLTEGVVELIDTGSTGRFDNAPGSGDFDYMMRVDKTIMDDPAKLAEVSNALLARFGKTEHAAGEVLGNGNLRLKGVVIDGLAEPVDIDISFVQKTNKVQYSTDMALADRLETIRQQSPEKHQQVVANIIFAKEFLKAAGAYKPNRGEVPQGGLGGVGVENWILQNGGSFLAAAKEFMAVAEKCKSFDEFRTQYAVWDFGENHMAKGGKVHDNFVADNMSPAGYEKMKRALASFLEQHDNES